MRVPLKRSWGLLFLASLWPATPATAAQTGQLEADLRGKLDERHRRAVELGDLCHARRDSQRAAAHYEMARRIRDDDFHVLTQLVGCYRTPGALPKLLSVYQSLVRLRPTDAAWLRELGSCHYRLGRPDEAEAIWRKILGVGPSRARSTAYLARTYERHGLFAKAAATYSQALALAPQDRAARLRLAEAQLRAGDLLGGLLTLATFEAAKGTSDAERADAVRQKAIAGLNLGRQARSVVRRALAAKAASAADLAWQVACRLEEAGATEAAARFYGRVAKEEPASDRGKKAAAKARQLTRKR